MTPEQLKELEEKAKLWDELSNVLHKLLNPIKQDKFVINYKNLASLLYPQNTTGESAVVATIQNANNASSHIGLLEEESKEMVTNQICQNCIIPSTDWCGKCFKCDKQLFKRINA